MNELIFRRDFVENVLKIVQSNYAGKIENQGVYTRRQYQKFISCLDKKPVHAGGRGNSWRPLFRTQKVDNSNTTNNFNNYNNSLMNNNYNRRGKLSFPSKMRSNVIETRLGAGGGMVGPRAARAVFRANFSIKLLQCVSANSGIAGVTELRDSQPYVPRPKPGGRPWRTTAPMLEEPFPAPRLIGGKPVCPFSLVRVLGGR